MLTRSLRRSTRATERATRAKNAATPCRRRAGHTRTAHRHAAASARAVRPGRLELPALVGAAASATLGKCFLIEFARAVGAADERPCRDGQKAKVLRCSAQFVKDLGANK